MFDKDLIVGSGLHIGDKVFVPIAEITKTKHRYGAWIQVIPVAIVVVEEKEEYLLNIEDEITLEELKTKIPHLDTEIDRMKKKFELYSALAK